MVVCLRQLNAGGIMRSCDPLRDFQKMCQVLLTISKVTYYSHLFVFLYYDVWYKSMLTCTIFHFLLKNPVNCLIIEI